MTRDATLRLEDFIQAVQSQLDNAQAAMTMKARNQNLPLTFAIKDINLDLRAHVEFAESEIRIRPAAAGEKEASIFHLVFTAITRPAIEENAISFGADDPDDQPLDDLGDELTGEERKRLEWAGVRTVKQFQQLSDSRGGVHTIGKLTNLPVDRLRKVLERSTVPLVERVEPVLPADNGDSSESALLRVRGRNLNRQGLLPDVRIGGRPVSILKSEANELLLAPAPDQWAGDLSVRVSPSLATSMSFDLAPLATAPAYGIAPVPEVETRQ